MSLELLGGEGKEVVPDHLLSVCRLNKVIFGSRSGIAHPDFADRPLQCTLSALHPDKIDRSVYLYGHLGQSGSDHPDQYPFFSPDRYRHLSNQNAQKKSLNPVWNKKSAIPVGYSLSDRLGGFLVDQTLADQLCYFINQAVDKSIRVRLCSQYAHSKLSGPEVPASLISLYFSGHKPHAFNVRVVAVRATLCIRLPYPKIYTCSFLSSAWELPDKNKTADKNQAQYVFI